MSAQFCYLQAQIESLIINDIVLSSPTLTDGKFTPGESINEKTLHVALTSSVSFPPGVVLQLQLVSSIDENGVRTPIEPRICVAKTTVNEKTIWFNFIGAQIPLPKGYTFLPNTLKTCASVRLEAGVAQKYCFLLSIKKCRTSPITCPGIPFVSRVLSNANCDIKCEKPEIVDQPDQDHPLKIYCQDTKKFVYSTLPHCVTHCQAPKPIFLYYPFESGVAQTLVGHQCSLCQ